MTETIDAAMRFEFTIALKPVNNPAKGKKQEERVEKMSHLRRNLVLAHQLNQILRSGQVASVKQLAEWVKTSAPRISQLLSLTLLAPAIQEKILFSQDPEIHALTERRVREIAMVLDWQEQRRMLQEV